MRFAAVGLLATGVVLSFSGGGGSPPPLECPAYVELVAESSTPDWRDDRIFVDLCNLPPVRFDLPTEDTDFEHDYCSQFDPSGSFGSARLLIHDGIVEVDDQSAAQLCVLLRERRVNDLSTFIP